MPNAEMDENQINKLILSKVTAEGADSGWMVALLLMQMMSTLKVRAGSGNLHMPISGVSA